MRSLTLMAGAAGAFAGRALVARALLWKFSRDVHRLNAGDHRALLGAYADDAVLRFNVGDHRFSGEWRGKPEIERFLQNFAAAGLQGEVKAIAMSGAPWAMTLWARFDDRAEAGGEELYASRTAVVLRTRWGKIVEHEDFWVDTAPMLELERRLTELGVQAIPKKP